MGRLSMNGLSTYRWSLKRDLREYTRAGYEGIGVWLQKLDGWNPSGCESDVASIGEVDPRSVGEALPMRYGSLESAAANDHLIDHPSYARSNPLSEEYLEEDEAIDALVESPLRVTCAVWSGGFTGSDGRSLAEGIDDTALALRQAAAMEAGCLVIYSGGRNNHILRHAVRLLHSALDDLVGRAEAFDLPLAIEPMHPASAGNWSFITDLGDVCDLVESYRSPHLQVALDTYHFPLDGVDRRVVERLVPHLGIVHLSDRRGPATLTQERCPLGEGVVNLSKTVEVLLDCGYTGDFDVKLYGPEFDGCNRRLLIQQSKDAYAKLELAVSAGM